MEINRFFGEFAFLSNFYPCEIVFDGEKYTSVENAYQAAKFADKEYRTLIREVSASKAKKIGRGGKIRGDWEFVKLSIMENLLRQKFDDIKLKKLLLETKENNLVEGNTWSDFYWGVCNGKGENNLGKLLMKIRSELKDNF